MIKNILLRNVASYDNQGVKIKDLKKINYVYGSNGTGKTTLSEFIRNPQDFNHCDIDWSTASQHETVVYNKHFVDETFKVQSPIKGIFTLGKDSSTLHMEIKELEEKIKKHTEDIDRIDENLIKTKDEKNDFKETVMNQLWTSKQEFDNHFDVAFTGYNSSRKKLLEKCSIEINRMDGSKAVKPLMLDDILAKKEMIYNNPRQKLGTFLKLTFDSSLESDSIYRTRILGKEDLDIAQLITSLDINDWVRSGYNILEKSNDLCPFCQRPLPERLEEKLNHYFDENYMMQISRLNGIVERYKIEVNVLMSKINQYIEMDNPYLNSNEVTQIKENIQSKCEKNILLLDQKLTEPATKITLESLEDLILQINSKLVKANEEIIKFNRIIENIDEEQKELNKIMWEYFCYENKGTLETYTITNNRLNKKINGLKQSEEIKEGHKKELEGQAEELRGQITSVEHSVIEINKVLHSFGFTNFKLKASEQEGKYEIVRDNGQDAKDTLSEGEKTFITFLYFYHLLKGSTDRETISTDKVVVIDDPVSSLDSDVLFIVSNLIGNLKEEIRENNSEIKQLVILTHNIYFHKEVTFNKTNNLFGDETYWILRKSNNITQITNYETNPIKTSYELLWNELKLIEEGGLITIQNVMRRILENYFKFFGDIKINELVDYFDDEDKIICNSLITWLHDGSHFIIDDLSVDLSKEQIERYFWVFKNIFIKSGHKAHYKMMMRGYEPFKFEQSSELTEEQARIEIERGLDLAASSSETK